MNATDPEPWAPPAHKYLQTRGPPPRQQPSRQPTPLSSTPYGQGQRRADTDTTLGQGGRGAKEGTYPNPVPPYTGGGAYPILTLLAPHPNPPYAGGGAYPILPCLAPHPNPVPPHQGGGAYPNPVPPRLGGGAYPEPKDGAIQLGGRVPITMNLTHTPLLPHGHLAGGLPPFTGPTPTTGLTAHRGARNLHYTHEN